MSEDEYVSVMQHAIGLDGNRKKPYIRHGKKFYRPYRNYFATAPQCDGYELWETLEGAGYAEHRENGKYVCFFVTRAGLDWLGEKMGVHIYDEEN